MREIVLLLRPKLQGARNGFRRVGQTRWRATFLAGLGLLFWLAVFAIVWGGLWRLHESAPLSANAVAAVAKKGLDFIVVLSLSVLLYSNIIVALSTYFLSHELDLIFATPVSASGLFYAKFIETLTASSWMIVLFMTPVLAGFAAHYGAPWYFFPAVPGLLLPFLVIPAALSVAFVLILGNVFPARRLRDLFFLLLLLGVSGVVFFVRYLRPELLINPEVRKNVLEYLVGLERAGSPLLPSTWMTESLSYLIGLPTQVGGQVPLFIGLLLTTAAALVVLCETLSGKLYFIGWSRSQEARRIESEAAARGGPSRFERVRARLTEFKALQFFPKAARRSLEAFCRGVARVIGAVVPGVHRPIIEKDLLIFFRDTQQWSQLLLVGAITAIYLLNMYFLNLAGGISAAGLVLFDLKSALSFLFIGMVGFVIAAICLRFVFPAVSLEGEALWLVRSAPITTGEFLRSKLWTYLPPLIVLGLVLEALSNYLMDVHPFVAWLGMGTVLLITAGVGAMGIGLGALYPNFRYENVARIGMGYGGILYMLLAMGYVAAVVVIEAVPVYLYLTYEFKGLPIGRPEQAAIAVALGLVVVLTAVVVWVPLRRGRAALDDPG